jgi:hypothetical protein
MKKSKAKVLLSFMNLLTNFENFEKEAGYGMYSTLCTLEKSTNSGETKAKIDQ